MNLEPIVMLLGHRDQPTDGVADYCVWLGDALQLQGYESSVQSVDWAQRGWRAALADLSNQSSGWRNRWAFMQYTTLAWSRRGFPIHAPEVLAVLRENGVRCCVVFHDFFSSAGTQIVDRIRTYVQLRIIKQLYALADRAVFPVPLNLVAWLPRADEKHVFIPVGANCPSLPATPHRKNAVLTVAVHSVTGQSSRLLEVADIGHAIRRASRNARLLKLVVFGRGSCEAEMALRRELEGSDVVIETLGLLSAEQISRTLAASDALLYVRGQISSRKGSALAGIACGLPIVCYSGPESIGPITEAGIFPVPLGDREALAAALDQVLTDASLRETLAARSRYAQQAFFSWPVIAAQFATALRGSVEEVTMKVAALARER